MDADLENSTFVAEAEPLDSSARKRVLFSILAAAWIFPSLGALFIIGGDWGRWFSAPSIATAVRSIAFEQWIALALLFFQTCFSAAAVYYWLRRPRVTNT